MSRAVRLDREAALYADLAVRQERRHRHTYSRHTLSSGAVESCPCGEVRRYDAAGWLVHFIAGRRDLVIALSHQKDAGRYARRGTP